MKIKGKNLYIGSALICMMMPESIKNSPIGIISTIVALLMSAIIIVFEYKKAQKGPALFFLITFGVIEMIATEVNKGSIMVWGKDILIYIALYFLVTGQLSKNENNFLKVGSLVLETYIYIEIFSVFTNWDFLGNYNQVYIMLPCLVAMILLIEKKNKKNEHNRRFWRVIIISVIACFFAQIKYGTNDLEASFLMSVGILILFKVFPKICNRISMKMCVVCMIFINVTLVVTQSLLKNRILQFVILKVFHKSLNLTGRTDLWSMSTYTILQKLLLGYGISWEGLNIWGGQFVPHNQFLYLACMGGILLIVCLIAWLIYIADKSDKFYKGQSRYKICQYALIAQLILFITLSYSYEQLISFWMMMDIISFYAEKEKTSKKWIINRKYKIKRRF